MTVFDEIKLILDNQTAQALEQNREIISQNDEVIALLEDQQETLHALLQAVEDLPDQIQIAEDFPEYLLMLPNDPNQITQGGIYPEHLNRKEQNGGAVQRQ